jgi:general secretion pathway protein L
MRRVWAYRSIAARAGSDTMAQTVFAALPDHETDAVLFAVQGASGVWTVSATPPEGMGRGRDLIAFAPSTRVTTRRMTLPTRHAPEARRAAGFQLEDELAEPLETLHIAVAPLTGTLASVREVRVVARVTLAGWIETLTRLGLPDAAILPETAVLDAGDAVADLGTRVAARIGGSGFGLDADMAADVLGAMQPEGASLSVHGERLAAALGRAPASPGGTDPGEALVWLAGQGMERRRDASWVSRHDLREGDFARRGAAGEGGGPAWLSPLGLGLVAACAALAGLLPVLQAGALDRQVQSVRDATTALARDALGDLSTGDPVGTLLAAEDPAVSGTAPGVRIMAGAVYEALAQVEGARVRALRWDGSAARLTVTLTVPGFADTDRLSESLRAAGLAVRVGDARQEANGVTGDFVLEPVR